jgi:hypothetical protein
VENLSPPAIEAVSQTTLEQIAFEAKSAFEAAKRSGMNTVERYKDAGEALTKAKAAVKHGEWLKWLAVNKISRTTAFAAMAIAANWSNVRPAEHLKDALKQITDSVAEEQEKTLPGTPVTAPALYCRHCRINGADKKCPDKDCRSYKDAHPPRKKKASTETSGGGDRASGGKPASPKWAWKPFNNCFEKVVKQVDHLAQVYGCKESFALGALKSRLAAFLEEIKKVQAQLALERKHGAQLPI